VVDDFGVKYHGKENAEHLLTALKDLYRIECDWEGKKYIGIAIDYNRTKREIRISMPGYINKNNLLIDLGINESIKGKDAPNKFIAVKYGKAAAKSTIPNKNNDVSHKKR
jgi:hypothetical protein